MWYEAIYGSESWEQLDKAPSHDWGTYLNWLKKVLRLPITNQCKLQEIIPQENGTFELVFEQFRGTEFKLDGQEYLILNIENVIGVM